MSKKSIIGGGAGELTNLDMDIATAHKTNTNFWDTIGSEFLGATALPYYGSFVTEEKLQLFGDVTNKKLLEIGCGNGHSLKYIIEKGAAELWGTDISPMQLERTKEFLASNEMDANLICAPMEREGGIPKQYFDYVYSVYAIGWTTDLNQTFCNISSYLKKDGIFIFSWSHPIHKCVSVENEELIFRNSYFDEGWYSVAMADKEIMLSNRKLSTYVNALAANGFVIEQMVEETDEDLLNPNLTDDFSKKAKQLPVTFVIKARKL